jgi:hypothetical protein
MALAFPSSPTVNQTYTSGTRTWTWNGTAWKLPSTALTGITGTGNAVLSVGPTITLPNATALPLTTGVTGILPVANGGTGISSPGASGNVLTSNGTNWTSAVLTVPQGIPTLVIVTATTQTAVAGNHYVITNVAATTITMPATVTVGDLIYITSGNGLSTNVIAYSGAYKIMGLLENLTINTTAYTTMQLRYLNATIGWALI